MKDKLLYLTIGLLVGIIVMQWTMYAHSGDAQAQTSTVSAQQFFLEDADGNLRGLWRVAYDGVVEFQLLSDDDAKLAIGISNKGTPFMALDNKQVPSRIHGMPYGAQLRLVCEEARAYMTVSAGPNASRAGLTRYDHTIALVAGDASGTRIMLRDSSNTRVSIGNTYVGDSISPKSSIFLYDEDGNIIHREPRKDQQ